MHTREGTRIVPVSAERSPRELLLDELYEAVDGIRAPLHDGPWALASLELCLAVMESGRSGREVALAHQVAVPRPVSTPA